MLATLPPPLLAANAWEVAIGIIFFAIYIISQLVSAREGAKKKKPPRRQPPRPPQRPMGDPPLVDVAAPQPQNQEEALRREVEDFLRRAQGKPPRQEKPAQPQRREQTPKRLVAKRTRPEPAPRKPLVSMPTARPATDLRSESVTEHVAKHISSKQLTEHAEQLGDDVAMADDRMELRLHKKFDHQLGSLQHQEKTAVAGQQSNAAAEIAELMRKPGGMRQLIIAQEILRRPEHW